MFESPRSLQEVCVDFICDNVLSISRVLPGDITDSTESLSSCLPVPNKSENHEEGNSDVKASPKSAKASPANTSSNDVPSSCAKLTFKDPDTFLPTEISEPLLYNLCEKKVLSDLTIGLFDAKTTRLRHVKLKDASNLTVKGLNVLKQHKVVDLEVNDMKIAPDELIACLGEWSLQNLRTLNVARGRFLDFAGYRVVMALNKLQSLQTLNVSDTELNRHGLETIVKDLPLLENLDISCTRVDDISPLKKCKDRLKVLNMYNVHITGCGNLISVLREMHELRHLDISGERLHAFEKLEITCLLKDVNCMPHLISLDISGKDEVDAEDLRQFIGAHSHLQFLGLVHLDVCFEECFTNPVHRNYRADLVVSGTASEPQILEALRRYPARPFYVQKCLYSLFRLTRNFNQVRVDIIKLVVPGMKAHPNISQVQTAATACLYKLTKDELASQIHSTILKQIVELTLTAMEVHPKHYQLQKNTLLTLCSDRILQDVSFDKYRCTKLVMNCLSAFDDSFMNRMSVAICSILAARISTIETSMIGAQPEYMTKLLAMVREKVDAKSVDITMKFTLSALWNLTDESATTCKVFLQKGGFKLFLEVLECFKGESSVEAKVLGLLNNIAEVNILRTRLMQRRFLRMLSSLLDSEYIDVSYFAAGVAAHLLSDASLWVTEISWKSKRTRLLNQLERAVTEWETPQREMVAYRSFKPFFPLLTCEEAYPVQLWAIWAMHHVCTKNPKRYCEMLIRQKGVRILYKLQEDVPTSQYHIHQLCKAILDTIEKHPC